MIGASKSKLGIEERSRKACYYEKADRTPAHRRGARAVAHTHMLCCHGCQSIAMVTSNECQSNLCRFVQICSSMMAGVPISEICIICKKNLSTGETVTVTRGIETLKNVSLRRRDNVEKTIIKR